MLAGFLLREASILARVEEITEFCDLPGLNKVEPGIKLAHYIQFGWQAFSFSG
jgi:hypothetical protein